MTVQGSNVLIVGAGPTGLVAAICLAQNGIPVRIIDKSDGPQIGQRGAALQPRVLELFGLVGVAHEILKEAGPLPLPLSYDLPGSKPNTAINLPLRRKPSPDIPYPNLVILAQDRTEAILRAHLENRHGIKVEFGTTLDDFEQGAKGVIVKLTSSRNGLDLSALTVKWLIGADGPQSLCRKHAGIAYVGDTREHQRFLIGDLHIRSGLDRVSSHRWGDFRTKGIGLRASERQDDTLFQFVIGGSEVPHAELKADKNAPLSYMLKEIGKPSLKFGEMTFVDDWRPNIRMASKFSEGRVFIAGDAAHVHCTSGGQGIVSCVQDAINLGWKLSLVERGVSSPALLSTYDEERRPIIKDMLAITTFAFDQIIADKGTTSPLGSLDLRQFGVNYRQSSIITPKSNYVGTYGAIGGIPQAGDRAPNAPELVHVESHMPTSVFEMLTIARHTALIFTSSAEQATPFVHALEEAPQDTFQWAIILPNLEDFSGTATLPKDGFILFDGGGHATRAYSPCEGRTVIVIRPDGVIGTLTDSLAGIQKYLELICTV